MKMPASALLLFFFFLSFWPLQALKSITSSSGSGCSAPIGCPTTCLLPSLLLMQQQKKEAKVKSMASKNDRQNTTGKRQAKDEAKKKKKRWEAFGRDESKKTEVVASAELEQDSGGLRRQVSFTCTTTALFFMDRVQIAGPGERRSAWLSEILQHGSYRRRPPSGQTYIN